jgi:hypothetical protein
MKPSFHSTAIDLAGLEYFVEFYHYYGERQTRTHEGVDPYIEITRIYFKMDYMDIDAELTVHEEQYIESLCWDYLDTLKD